MTVKILTQDYLKECFEYNADTGILTWKKRPRLHFRADRTHSVFNKITAGRSAGCVSKTDRLKYLRVKLDQKMYSVHRLICFMVNGCWPDEVDHQDGNGLNNRWSNLRDVSRQVNSCNQRLPSNNTSGQRGVQWYESMNKWVARINIKGKRAYLGAFTDINEAINIRKEAEKRYGYHENHGR